MDKYRQNNGTLDLPDTLFVMNAYDKPLCPAGTCAAPLFSYNKPWLQRAGPEAEEAGEASDGDEEASNTRQSTTAASEVGRRRTASVEQPLNQVVSTSAKNRQLIETTAAVIGRKGIVGASSSLKVQRPSAMAASSSAAVTSPQPVELLPDVAYDDVLFPVLNHPFDHLVYFPWGPKKHATMMRAGIYAAMNARCSRVKCVGGLMAAYSLMNAQCVGVKYVGSVVM